MMVSDLGSSVLQAGKAVAFGEAFPTCPNQLGGYGMPILVLRISTLSH